MDYQINLLPPPTYSLQVSNQQSLANLKGVDDVQFQMLLKIQEESEQIMKNRKPQDYFQTVFSPLKITTQDENETRSVIKAINEISAYKGETQAIEEQLEKNIQMKQPTDYNIDQFNLAKRVYEDCEQHNGNSHSKNLNLVQKFQKLSRDLVIGHDSQANPSIDQVSIKSMGFYKALNERNNEVYQQLKQNRLHDNDIIDYLDEESRNDSNSIDKYMSEDIKSELQKYQMFTNWDDDNYKDFDLDSCDLQTPFTPPEKEEVKKKKITSTAKQMENELAQYDSNNHYKIQQQIEKQKMRMYEDIENLDFLLKNSENNLTLSKSEYMQHIRILYHEKLISLKNAQDLFHNQLKRMQRAHLLQMKNIETFALSAAVEMFKAKARQVHELYSNEIMKVNTDYYQLHNLLNFYEKKIRQLTGFLINQEKIIIEQSVYIVQYLKRKGEYKDRKNLARVHLNELIKEKYNRFENKEYLNNSFDFYSMHLRLVGHDKDKIVKGIAFKLQEKETQEHKAKYKLLENQNKVLVDLLAEAQESEQKARDTLAEAMKDIIVEREQYKDTINSIHKKYQAQILNIQDYVQRKENERLDYRKLVNTESDLCHRIIDQQRKLVVDYRNELKMTLTLLNQESFSTLYQDKLKKLSPNCSQNTKNKLIGEVYHQCMEIMRDRRLNQQIEVNISHKLTPLAHSGGMSSPAIWQAPNSRHSNQKNDKVFSQDESQFQQVNNLKPDFFNISQNLLSTTTRIHTQSIEASIQNESQTHKTSIEWNKSSRAHQRNQQLYGNTTLTNNSIESEIKQHTNNGHAYLINKQGSHIFSQPQTRGRYEALNSSFEQNQISNEKPRRDHQFFISMNNFNSIRANTQRDIRNISDRRPNEIEKLIQRTTERMVPQYVNRKLVDIKRQRVTEEDLIQEKEMREKKKHHRSQVRTNILFRRDKQFSLNERSIRKQLERFNLNSSVEVQNGGIFENRAISNYMKITNSSIDQ